MQVQRPSPWMTMLAGGFGLAGLSKLLNLGIQRRLYERWGIGEQDLKLIGGAELLGAALLLSAPTRRLGGAALTVTSAAVLASELNSGESRLGLPRLAMLLAAVTAI